MLTTKAGAEQIALVAHRQRMLAIGAPAGRDEYDRQVARMVVDVLDGGPRPLGFWHEHDEAGACADCDAAVVLTFLEDGNAVELFERQLQEAERSAWWYFSFADGSLPEGEQFLGGAYVNADTAAAAITRSRLIGVNPGGEAQIHGPISAEHMDANVQAPDRERLLSRSELEAR
jgi:hypothetical protein